MGQYPQPQHYLAAARENWDFIYFLFFISKLFICSTPEILNSDNRRLEPFSTRLEHVLTLKW